MEVVFTKFGMLSLEHVSRGVERVRVILEEMFLGQEESQKMALDLILTSFNFPKVQDYAERNMFQQRNKIITLIVRLNQLGIFESQIVINWCIEKLSLLDTISIELLQF